MPFRQWIATKVKGVINYLKRIREGIKKEEDHSGDIELAWSTKIPRGESSLYNSFRNTHLEYAALPSIFCEDVAYIMVASDKAYKWDVLSGHTGDGYCRWQNLWEL